MGRSRDLSSRSEERPVWPRSFIPAILSVLALTVAACGDGDSDDGGGGKTEIARDINLDRAARS